MTKQTTLLREERRNYEQKVPGVENMSKTNTKNEQDYENNSTTLVGYVRKSNAGRAVKLSINTSAFQDCATYVTSDGQTYVQLIVSLNVVLITFFCNKKLISVKSLDPISRIFLLPYFLYNKFDTFSKYSLFVSEALDI